MSEYEIVTRELEFYGTATMIMERFEIMNCSQPISPIVLAKRYIKNLEGKTYNYSTYVDRENYNKYLSEYKESAKEVMDEATMINLSLCNAYHEKFGEGPKMKEIETLENSKQYDFEPNISWKVIGSYVPKKLVKKQNKVIQLKKKR